MSFWSSSLGARPRPPEDIRMQLVQLTKAQQRRLLKAPRPQWQPGALQAVRPLLRMISSKDSNLLYFLTPERIPN